MSASLLLPVHGAEEYVRACLESVHAARNATPFEVVAVDNGSPPALSAWLADEARRRPALRHLRFDEPLGFARAVNEAARRARSSRLVLLNSDTLVTDGWLDALASALDADPGLGVVSPLTNRCGSSAQVDPEARALAPHEAPRHARRIRRRPGPRPEPQRLAFFCAMVRRSLWEWLGGLDEAYATGNFEDDDFCLRARLAGFRLAVVPGAFVYHHERRSFEAGGLDHAELLARNQVLFCGRASRLSRAPLPERAKAGEAPELSVLVPAPALRAAGLEDSLRSLANQTLGGFEVVVVASGEPPALPDWARERLRVTAAKADPSRGDTLPVLANAGLAASGGSRIALLPAGDVHHPYHLEVLREALAAGAPAAYTAWSVAAGKRRGAVRLDQAAPERLPLGDWAALAGWMFARGAPALAFDESFPALCGWELALRVLRESTPTYLPRLTCEKRAWPLGAQAEAEARRLAEAFPVEGEWARAQRRHFLAALRTGRWEERLLLEHNEAFRRARRMLAPPPRLRLDARALAAARERLEGAAASRAAPARATASSPLRRASAPPAALLFSILGWGHLTQRPHHFARGLGARGWRVLWVDVALRDPERADSATLAREFEAGLWRTELPAARGDLYRLAWREDVLGAMEAAFACLRGELDLSRAVQLVHFPKWTPLVRRLRGRFGWPVVYDCLDDQQAFGRLHPGNDAGLEDALVRECDALTTSGRTLHEALRARRPDAILLPNAAELALFRDAAPAAELRDLPRPVVGFFGAFADWLDLDWIAESARRFPQWSFVYVGREGFARAEARRRWWALRDIPNVHVLSQVGPPALARLVAGFDVCTLPFRESALTRAMNPVKVYEALAAGKPVVAPDLPELRPFSERGLVATWRDREESFRLLEAASREGGEGGEGSAEERVRARRAFAAENTWSPRVDRLDELLRAQLPV